MASLITWKLLSSGCIFLANLQPAGPGTRSWGAWCLSQHTAARTTRPRSFNNSDLRSTQRDKRQGRHVQGRRLHADPDLAELAPHAEYIEQPKDYYHHHHDVEDLFDLPIHRDVGVDEPE